MTICVMVSASVVSRELVERSNQTSTELAPSLSRGSGQASPPFDKLRVTKPAQGDGVAALPPVGAV